MRVVLPVRLSILGLVLVAASGNLPAQQARNASTRVRPIETITIDPATAKWSDFLAIQAASPQRLASEEVLPSWLLEPPTIEVPEGLARQVSVAPVGAGGGRQALCAGFAGEPDLEQNFDSQLDVPDGGSFSYIPPDTAGGVGPNHLMTALNNKVLIQDRLGGTVSSVDLSVFWSPLTGTLLTYPRVFYDNTAGRWIATARSGSTGAGATAILFAISDSSDPTGAWSFYSILADPGATSFADWTMPGANTTWIAFAANMFNLPGTTSLGAKLWAVDKATALVPGGPITVSVFPTGYTTAITGIAGSTSFQPAQTYDATPGLFLVSNSFTSGGVFILQTLQITGTGPAPTVSGIPGSTIVTGTSGMTFVVNTFTGTQRTMPQVGDARFITPFSVRIQSVVARNGKLWVVHNGGTPGPSTNAAPSQTSVCWYEIDPSLMPAGVAQSGQISSGAVGSVVSMPSIAVNCGEDIVVGFSRGDATRNPECSYAVRLGSDPLNTMGPIRTLKTGNSSYWKNFGVGTTAQWGRYSSSAVDPNDDHTLWTLQEYAGSRVGALDNDSRWATHWGRLGSCGAPTIDVDPVDVTVCAGDPTAFSVMATAFNAPMTFQWRKDGVDLPGETASSYSIASTTIADGGTYDVVVEDGCGRTTSLPAVLGFSGATFGAQPISQGIFPGSPVTFSVVASGTGTLGYQWLKDGNPIALATSDMYSIASVTVADFGYYSCIVTDDCGPVTSDSARLWAPVKGNNLHEAELSLHIFRGPESTVACDGASASFSVLAFPAGATYSWRFNGVPIVPAQTGPSLVINPVSAGDAGSYDVVVSLGNRSRQSTSAVLVVNGPPTISVQPSPRNATLSVGDSITYSVTATGIDLQYQWQYKTVQQGAVFVNLVGETDSSLTLSSVSLSNSGTYRCVISNGCGSVNTRQLTLIVF